MIYNRRNFLLSFRLLLIYFIIFFYFYSAQGWKAFWINSCSCLKFRIFWFFDFFCFRGSLSLSVPILTLSSLSSRFIIIIIIWCLRLESSSHHHGLIQKLLVKHRIICLLSFFISRLIFGPSNIKVETILVLLHGCLILFHLSLALIHLILIHHISTIILLITHFRLLLRLGFINILEKIQIYILWFKIGS